MWQYVWVNEAGDALIHLMNGEQDRQGVGLFARFSFADQDTNAIEWTANGGVGGKGIIRVGSAIHAGPAFST